MKAKLLTVLAIVLASCSPQAPKVAQTSPQAPAPAAAPVTPAEVVITTGVLTYTTGDVEVQTAGAWTPIDTGDTVSVNAKVRTGKKSSCDIQFAQLGVVHLAESTQVSLNTIGVSSKKKAVDLELVTGAVTAKVSKLLGNDRFQVKTDTVVCGVRGTRFVVTKPVGAPTTIGVAEGSVALLPPTYDAQKLDDLSTSPDQTALIDAVKASILESSTTVGVGSQVVVTKASLEKPAQAITKIQASLEQLPAPTATPAAAPAPGIPAAPPVLPTILAEALATYQKAAPGPGTPVVKAQTSETKKALVETAGLHVEEALPEAPPSKAPTPAVTPPVSSAPINSSIKFKLTLVPADADVQINGQSQGKGSTELTLPDASSFALQVKKFGYQDFQETIDPSKGERVKTVTLSKINPVTSQALGANRLLALQSNGTTSLAYDEKGNVTAFLRNSDSTIKVLWTAKAGQSASGIGIPAVTGSTLTFASDKQLVGIDTVTGSNLFSQPLNATNSGSLGRRPLILGGQVYLTSDQGLVVLDAKTGTATATIDLGEPADSTPAVFGGKIHVVGRNGTYFVIDPVTQKILAKAPTDLKQPVASAVVFGGNRAIAVDRKGTVLCLDPTDPTKPAYWEKKLDPTRSVSVFTDPVILENSVFLLSKNTLYTLSLQTGDPIGTPKTNVAGVPVEVGALGWAALSDGTLLGLNLATGAEQVRLSSNKKVSGAPLAEGQTVIFPTGDGSLVALRTDLAVLP